MKNKSGNDKTSLAFVTKDIIYRGSRDARYAGAYRKKSRIKY